MAADELNVVQRYEPVRKMQEKAAALRAELAGITPGMSGPEQHKTALRDRLTVKISEPGEPVQNRAPPTPANPRFKPQRPHVGPSARPTSAVSSRSFRQTDASGVSANATFDLGLNRAESNRWSGGPGTEPGSPTGSHTSSRRSVSPNRRSASALRLSLALQETNQQLVSRVTAAEENVRTWQRKHGELQEEQERRQESYMRREEQMQAQIDDLKAQLARAKGERSAEADARFGQASRSIKELHTQVEAEIEQLLNKQAVALKHEEQTALRKFKARLAEVEAELGAERGEKGRSATDWMERTRALRQELDAVQEIATKLDKMYRLSEEECSRLRAQFKCQEDDREFLIRQIVALKKENKRLSVELAAMAADARAAVQERDDLLATHAALGDPHQPMMPAQMAATMSLAGIDKDAVQLKVQRYEDVIESLKRLVEAERKRTRQARAAHTAELATRTELQTVLRQCVDDIRSRRQRVEAGEEDVALSTGPGVLETMPSGHSSARSSASGGAASTGSGRGRPMSAMPATSHVGMGGFGERGQGLASTSGRPISARMGASNFGPSGAPRSRPFSAMPRSGQRPMSAFGMPGAARAAASVGPGVNESSVPLMSEEREALVQELMAREELLKMIFDKAFPGVAPTTLPGDTERLDRLVSARDARDVTVVANAKALALMKAAGPSATGAAARAPAVPNSTPGGELAKEGAGRPWVFSVDAMLHDFLQGKGS